MKSKYTTKKIRNQEGISYTEKHLTPKSQQRFCECGNWIDFLADYEVSKMKVHQANFCKNRFCPMCAWRQSQKDAMKISILMDYIEIEHDKTFIFLTLTAPNVMGEDLKSEITWYNKAFKKLVERDEVKKVNQGYIRKIEITYNAYRNDYHPHFHCVFAVNKSYFKSRDYINQSEWLTLWREVMNDETITQVDVRRVKKNNINSSSRNKAINEIAKYSAKDDDYFISQDIFDVFYTVLKGRQVITFNGLFSLANKKYKSKELDYYKTFDETKYVWLILNQWGGSEYIEKRRKQVSEDEYKELKKESIDEMSI